MTVVFAAPHHDPEGALDPQLARVLPLLQTLFGGIAVHATETTSQRSLERLRAAGAVVRQVPLAGHLLLGQPRRGALELGLQLDGATLFFCDFDRALHWAECYPDELAAVVAHLPASDFTVLGRTARAYATHPALQRETEALANRVFALVSGQAWDIGAAARGVSRRAAETILRDCAVETIGTDAAWPLHLLRAGEYQLGYIETEGLEFETPDREHAAINALGGLDSWLTMVDSDPRAWVQRIEMARITAATALAYQE
jgi:hypothetical protein